MGLLLRSRPAGASDNQDRDPKGFHTKSSTQNLSNFHAMSRLTVHEIWLSVCTLVFVVRDLERVLLFPLFELRAEGGRRQVQKVIA